MIRKDQQQAIEWLLPSRPLPPPPQITPIDPSVNVRFILAIKVIESWCGKLAIEFGKRNMILGLTLFIQRCNKWSLTSLILQSSLKEGFLGIDSFKYPSWDTFLEEEEYAIGVYGERELVLKQFPIRLIIAPNPNSLIFKYRPTAMKVYPLGPTIFVFVGYPNGTKGYYFYNTYEEKVSITRIGVFLEKQYISHGANGGM